ASWRRVCVRRWRRRARRRSASASPMACRAATASRTISFAPPTRRSMPRKTRGGTRFPSLPERARLARHDLHPFFAAPSRAAAPEQGGHHGFGGDVRVAEAGDHGPEHGWIADAAVDADAPFLHLADDHVDGVGRRAEAGIELADVEAARRFLAARHGRERQT